MTTSSDRLEHGSPATSHEPPSEGANATAQTAAATPASQGDAGARHGARNGAAALAIGAGGPGLEGTEHQGRPEPAASPEPSPEPPQPAGRAGELAVVVDQPSLAAALALVARAAAGVRTTLPILANVLLEAGDGGLTLACTDLEWALRVAVPADVATPGSLTVPAARLLDFVRTLAPCLPVSLVRQPGQSALAVSQVGGRPRALLKGIDIQEYEEHLSIPTVPDAATTPPAVTLPAATLRRVIDLVAFSAAPDEARPVLAGVHLRATDGRLLAETADGFRLSVWRGAVDAGAAETADGPEGGPPRDSAQPAPDGSEPPAAPRVDVLVRASQAEHLAALLAGAGEGPAVALWTLPPGAERANQVALRFLHAALGQVEAVLRLLEGAFPDLERVIPAAPTTRAVCDLEPLALATRRAGLFSIGNVLALDCRLAGAPATGSSPTPGSRQGQADQSDAEGHRPRQRRRAPRGPAEEAVTEAPSDTPASAAPAGAEATLRVSANGVELGEGQDDVPAVLEGPPLAIQLNAEHLAEVLRAVKGAGAEQVRLSFTGPRSPVRIEALGGEHLEDYRHVTMPMALVG
jgi:DNA polymerase-3 subunit beta